MKHKLTFSPGDLFSLRSTYRGTRHPDDFIVGIVLSRKNKLLVLFSERNGTPAIESISLQEAETYYRILNSKRV